MLIIFFRKITQKIKIPFNGSTDLVLFLVNKVFGREIMEVQGPNSMRITRNEDDVVIVSRERASFFPKLRISFY